MSEIILPSLDNNKLKDSITISSNAIKNKNIVDNVKSYRSYLLENNNLNKSCYNSLKKGILKKSVNYEKNLKANLIIIYTKKNLYKVDSQIKRFLKNKIYLNFNNTNIKRNNNKNLNLFINNSYNSSVSDNNPEDNFFDNSLNKGHNLTLKYKKNNIYNETDINNINNDFIKNKNISKSIEVKKIIDSLTNKTNKNKKSQTIKIEKFPNAKSIDPFSYINHNLKKNPYDTLYKGVKSIINKIEDGELKEEYKHNLIKKSSDINNLKIDSNQLKAPLDEAKIYKNKYEDMIKQTKTLRSFYFSKYENHKKKTNLKFYDPQMKYLDKTYKLYFNKKFKFKTEDNNNKIERNRTNPDFKFEKIDKYLSFDKKINNIILISKKTEKNINSKSKEHKEMLSKINFIQKSYS